MSESPDRPQPTLSGISQDQVEHRIRACPDRLVGDLFRDGSFQSEAYGTAGEGSFENLLPEKADASVLRRWNISAEEWVRQMRAVGRARRHDEGLSLMRRHHRWD